MNPNISLDSEKKREASVSAGNRTAVSPVVQHSLFAILTELLKVRRVEKEILKDTEHLLDLDVDEKILLE